MGDVLAYTADKDTVVSGGFSDRGRVPARLTIIQNLYAWRLHEQLSCRPSCDFLAGLDMDRLRMAVKNGHPHGRGVYPDAVVPEYLLGLPDKFHLFFGIAVVLELINVG